MWHHSHTFTDHPTHVHTRTHALSCPPFMFVRMRLALYTFPRSHNSPPSRTHLHACPHLLSLFLHIRLAMCTFPSALNPSSSRSHAFSHSHSCIVPFPHTYRFTREEFLPLSWLCSMRYEGGLTTHTIGMQGSKFEISCCGFLCIENVLHTCIVSIKCFK